MNVPHRKFPEHEACHPVWPVLRLFLTLITNQLLDAEAGPFEATPWVPKGAV